MALVLGLYPGGLLGHDASACIVRNGSLICAAEEERFARVKHAPRLAPKHAIKFCLERAKVTPDELDAVAVPWILSKLWHTYLSVHWRIYGLNPAKLPIMIFNQLYSLRLWAGLGTRQMLRLTDLPDNLHAKVVFVEHHKAHAMSAYAASNFASSAVVTIDGTGETNSTCIWDAVGNQLTKLDEEPIKNSLGTFFGYMTGHLGFEPNEGEGKTMALAAFGNRNETVEGKVRSIINPSLGRNYWVSPDIARTPTRREIVRGGKAESRQLLNLLGPMRSELQDPLSHPFPEIAFAAQEALVKSVCRVVERAVDLTGKNRVCMAGGVALNCRANQAILKSGVVDDLFAFPAANDGGAAVGAALVVSQMLGDRVNWRMEHVCYGPEYADDEIEEVLRRIKVAYERCEDLPGAVGEMIAKGMVVGWFQGRAELGPRALGARSILADPRYDRMARYLNGQVKGRESWRPFAPSMLDEAKEEYLEDAREAPFMIVSFDVRKERINEIAAVVHVDGTTRPHTVKKQVNERYWKVIKAFEEKTGIPMVLNTSFNLKREPIVNLPIEAIRDLYSSGLDALAIGSFLVRKS